MQQMPDALQPVDRFHGEVGKEGAEKPEARDHGHRGALAGEGSTAEDQTLRQGDDRKEQKNNVGETGADPERYPPPKRNDGPESAIPQTVGEKQQRQKTHTKNDPEN